MLLNSLRTILKHLSRPFRHLAPYPITILPLSKQCKGNVLISYIANPILWADDDERFYSHSNLWESREIARIFADLGYSVDVIDFRDEEFVPFKPYEVVFDIYNNLGRLSTYVGKHTLKILHCTGSDPYYQNAAELSRVSALNRRHSGHYHPKRLIADSSLNYQSLQVADVCSLIGNEYTWMTYPKSLRTKFHLLPVSTSCSRQIIKTEDKYVPLERGFLWYFGYGAVHKGLDLVLDVFAKHPELTLHIVGRVDAEDDFMYMYKQELNGLPNIHYYGYLATNSPVFQEILHKSFCIIAPSCSEGISPAVVTCMQIGLYPLVSRDTGITLPPKCGMYLENCSVEEIEKAVQAAYCLLDADLKECISVTQKYAIDKFSREIFRSEMMSFIIHAINHDFY
jgi:glycosyltransferase involved in cell wall biosynthesis